MENPDLPKAFLAHVRTHNFSVLWALCMSVCGTALLWPFLYLLSYAVALLVLAVAVGPYGNLPPEYPLWFALGALVSFPILLGLDWFLQRFCAPFLHQHLYFRWLMELLVAPHRMTLSIGGHLGAFCFLSRGDKKLMVRLLRMMDEHRHLEIRRVEVEVPQRGRRQRVMEALSLMDLTHLTRLNDRLCLVLKDADVRKMLYPRVKVRRKRSG
jgi:hypothetical protein